MAIYALFKINLVTHIRLISLISKQFHLPPMSFSDMYYWEFELYIKFLNQNIQEENDAQKAEMDKYHVGEYLEMSRPGNIQKMVSIPKMSASGPAKIDMGSFGKGMDMKGFSKGFKF